MAQYDRFAETYYKRRFNKDRFNYNRDIEVPAMLQILGNVKGKTILDMGCGFGYHMQKLVSKGAKKIIGFDACPKLIKLAKESNLPRCEISVGDMEKRLPFKNSTFDIVFSSLAVHYVKNLDHLFAEAHRVLNKGGIFAFSTGHPIFNLLNQTDKHIIGMQEVKGKVMILGDYFNQSMKKHNLGKDIGKVKLYAYNHETFIKTAVRNKFEIIDYIDAKPSAKLKKTYPERYNMTTKLPTFVIFKLKKR